MNCFVRRIYCAIARPVIKQKLAVMINDEFMTKELFPQRYDDRIATRLRVMFLVNFSYYDKDKRGTRNPHDSSKNSTKTHMSSFHGCPEHFRSSLRC